MISFGTLKNVDRKLELDLQAKAYLIRRKGCAFDATVASLTAEGFTSI